MNLDAHTITTAFVLLSGVTGTLLLFAWGLNRKVAALAWWGTAFWLVVAGVSLVALGRGTPNTFGLIVGNALAATAYGCQYIGCRVFNRRRPAPHLALGGGAVWLLAWPLIGGWQEGRVVLMSGLVSTYGVLSAWELWRHAPQRLRSQSFAISVILSNAGFYLVRAIFVLSGSSAGWLSALSSRWSAETALLLLLYVPVIAFVFLAMAKERADIERRQDAGLVEESEARYRALVEASSLILWRATPDGAIVEAHGWDRYVGELSKEFRGQGWLEAVHPEDRGHAIEVWRRVVASGQPGGDEFRVRDLTGEYRWVATRTVPIRNRDGSIREWVGTLTDIHEHKLAQEELRAALDINRTTLDNMDQGLFMIDADDIIRVYNHKALQLLDLPESLLTTRPTFQSVRQYQMQTEEFAKNGETFRQWVSSGGLNATPDAYERERPNGKVLEIRTVPLPGGGAVRTYTDITARRKAEAELKASEERYRLIAESTSDMIVRGGLDGARLYVSPAAYDVLGYKPEELAGSNAAGFVHPDDRPAWAATQQSLATGELDRATSTHRLRHKNGTWVWVEVGYRLVRDETGRPREIVSVNRDISGRLHLEAQLRQSQKMEAVGQLTGGLAHDFNNLLTVILGNAELLLETLDQPATRTLVEMIEEAAGRGADLTQQLLAFGRRQSLRPERIEPGDVVRGMTPLLRRTLGEHIEFRTVLPAEEVFALADRTQLESAILNLVVNARDAMPQGGTITIHAEARTAQSGDGGIPVGQPVVAVSVTDTGIGMTPEVLARVFEPFFTTKDVGKGSGLGLSMVYGFAEQSGGHVSIESAPGMGTTVTILLLAVSREAAEPVPRSIPVVPVSGGSERILVVEDEPQVRQFVCSQLRSLGYHVQEAQDGRTGLELLRTQGEGVDLLFTDVVLPHGMSGVELARQARQLSPNLRILLTSGYSEDAFEHRGRPDADTLLLRKPYKRQELARTLRRALGDGR